MVNLLLTKTIIGIITINILHVFLGAFRRAFSTYNYSSYIFLNNIIYNTVYTVKLYNLCIKCDDVLTDYVFCSTSLKFKNVL